MVLLEGEGTQHIRKIRRGTQTTCNILSHPFLHDVKSEFKEDECLMTETCSVIVPDLGFDSSEIACSVRSIIIPKSYAILRLVSRS